MWIKDFQYDRLIKDIERLQTEVGELKHNSVIYVDKYPDAGLTHLPNRWEKVPIRDVVNRVVDHCGLSLAYKVPVGGALEVRKKGKGVQA